jgi:hypothetical protein
MGPIMVYYFRREQEQSTANAPGYFEPITLGKGREFAIGEALLGGHGKNRLFTPHAAESLEESYETTILYYPPT